MRAGHVIAHGYLLQHRNLQGTSNRARKSAPLPYPHAIGHAKGAGAGARGGRPWPGGASSCGASLSTAWHTRTTRASHRIPLRFAIRAPDSAAIWWGAMAAMAAAKAEFLGQSVVTSKSGVVAHRQGALRVVSLLTKGKKAAAKATKQVKKAAPKLPSPVKKAPSPVKKAASAVRKAAATVNRPSNEELAKWYGPDRRIYLPEGLLAKEDIPAYLNGEVPGDYGYDPLGLSKKPDDFDKYQAYELIHGRWAMLGAAGFVLPEAFNKFGAVCGPEAVWWKTGALLLDGNTIQYFGATVPVNLAVAVIAEIILVGGAEYYRSINKSPLGSNLDRLHPGGAFDPLGLANDPDQFALLKVKEIKNGRLAMFSMLGFFIQAYVTGEGPVENLSAHLSDPFGNNLLTVLQGTAERVPSL